MINIGDYFKVSRFEYFVKIVRVVPYVKYEIVFHPTDPSRVSYAYEEYKQTVVSFIEAKSWVPVSKEQMDDMINNWALL